MKILRYAGLLLIAPLAGAYVTSSVSLNETSLQKLVVDNKVLQLEDLIQYLPLEMRVNFTLKHGIKRIGERGHLIEQKVSQSSDPDLPRAILWNENTGFTVSYNGGGANQTANQRLDILSFDQKTKTFRLSEIDFPLTEAQILDSHSPVVKSESSCQECHGPLQRPIFSMYPDWPSFYGSDNDELNNPKAPHQHEEMKDYAQFTSHEAVTNHRYSPLFDKNLVKQVYGMDLWDTYPYRQNTSEEPKNITRSFSFRPGLRLGIIYNRLNAEAVFKIMKEHKNYDKYSLLTLHSLLQCSWNPKYPKTREAVLAMVKKDSPTAPQWVGGDGLQLHYHQIWNLFGLRINDVDIRYSYNHPGYQNIDASKKIMEPGYIGRYFNSYFDGTATFDELIAAKLLTDLSMSHPELKNLYHLRGLQEKYKHLVDRYKYDKELFANYDRLGEWFAMPYAQAVFAPQHREKYSDEMKKEYNAVCAKTVELLKSQVIK